ncbi:MAG: hypothetical protein ABFD06_15170 [Smithella sp.]
MKEITISMAEKISKETGYDEIVIFGYNPISKQQHVTTFGKTKEQCIDAAKAGNFLKKALGWPDELCKSKPNLKNKE